MGSTLSRGPRWPQVQILSFRPKRIMDEDSRLIHRRNKQVASEEAENRRETTCFLYLITRKGVVFLLPMKQVSWGPQMKVFLIPNTLENGYSLYRFGKKTGEAGPFCQFGGLSNFKNNWFELIILTEI